MKYLFTKNSSNYFIKTIKTADEMLENPDSLNGVTINIVDSSLDNYLKTITNGNLKELSRDNIKLVDINLTIIVLKDSTAGSSRLFRNAFAINNGKLYQIGIVESTDKPFLLFDPILSTFKFIK